MYTNPFTESFPNTCLSCGFLSIIDRTVYGGKPSELSSRGRAEGILSDHQTLWCFRRKAVLSGEMLDAQQRIEAERNKPGTERIPLPPDAPSDRAVAITEVLQKNRSFCVNEGAWYEWVEHFGPQWHYEDWRMTELEKLRQAQTKMIADAERRGQEAMIEIGKITAQAQSDHLELAMVMQREGNWYQRAFLLVAALALALALAPLAYPNGIGWVDDLFPGGIEEPAQGGLTATEGPSPTASAEPTSRRTPSPESTPGAASTPPPAER